ncbi:MAG: methylated-DNA--[protein]-cysteine S-methyltransferase [Desulfobacterales bacterium]|nr:methylated-DNA--[protein]-cysteine S-methyltransferase [Desulfobacterales bacterium]
MGEVYYASCSSPIGTIWVATDKSGVCLLSFKAKEAEFLKELSGAGFQQARADQGFNRGVLKEIKAYFEGKVARFSSRLHPQGGPFDMRVWQALQRIPLGETRSYQEIACSIGNPGACRAVGGANSRNPIPLLIPCHRVIRKDGGLGGFSSGTAIKQWLLQFEQRVTCG